MSVLIVSRLGLSFGSLDLFSGVSVTVPPGAKIGLVGPNGVGKTSLLMILSGQLAPTAGSVRRAKWCRIGFLPQESADAYGDRDHSLFEELLTVFDALRDTEQRLRQMENAISQGANGDLLERYGNLQERFESSGGYDYESRARRALAGLGLDEDSWAQPLTHLSGGQKTRALLARLVLAQPDLLILDEPTNHLDMAAIEWLEGHLGAWPGALIVVSHDRYFLDQIVDTIWEMRPTGIERYRGNYSAYVLQQEERWVRRRKEFDALKNRLTRELDFVRRNIAGQRSKEAQGRLARVSREVEAVHAGGLEAARAVRSKGWLQATHGLDMGRPSANVNEVARRISQLHLPDAGPPEMHLDLSPLQRGADLVLRSKGLEIGFPGRRLFAADDIELMHGDCAALIGGNGTGKTTFLRTVLGEVEPLAGELKVGANLQLGYLAQSHDDLPADSTVLELVMRRGSLAPGQARSHLAQFLFRQDEVLKPVAALSGGERGRLALALLALQRANVLLLDEPTNHLDIPAQEVLQSVLQIYEGSILLVTHDRYLIDRLATQVWEIADGRLRISKCRYHELLAQRRKGTAPAARASSGPVHARAGVLDTHTGSTAAGSALPPNSRRQPADGAQGLSKNEVLRLERRRSALEVSIEQLESELAQLEEELQHASEAADVDRVRELGDRYEKVRAKADAQLDEWAALG